MNYTFSYVVKLDSQDGPRTVTGSAELTDGSPFVVECALPEGTLRSVQGMLRLPAGEDTMLFMNGFQSWTYCPERKPEDRMHLCHLPGIAQKKLGLDRYGDDYFLKPQDRPGFQHGESYCYFRTGDTFRLFASLSENLGYTVFCYGADEAVLSVSRDCEGVRCGGSVKLFELYAAEGTEQQVFDGWFAALGITARTKEPLEGYSSWYNRYQKIDAPALSGDLSGAVRLLPEGAVFQIDDGWEPKVGDWLEPDPVKFPAGLCPFSKAIHENGLKAGLWLAPFVAQKGSALMKQHPDWLLNVDGEPWYCGCNWGGFYALDIDKPPVQAYLRRVFRRVLEEWDFDLVKLDFLYAAAPVNTPKESRAARMRRAMQLLRELCGEKKILGCGVPLMPAFGLVDYCRIGCDVGLDWNDTKLMQLLHRERVSTFHSLSNTVFRRQLNGRAFLNDPDVFFLRENNIRLNAEQKQLLAVINSIYGGVFLTSDDISAYTPAQQEQYEELKKYRGAENARAAFNGSEVSVTFTLDGVSHTLTAGEK